MQISLWKVDRFGVVKTKDRYFTPTHEIFRQKENIEFDIVSSLDGETIMLQERNFVDKCLIIIINAFTLEVMSELCFTPIDINIDEESDDDYYGNNSSDCPTTPSTPRFLNWNNGR